MNKAEASSYQFARNVTIDGLARTADRLVERHAQAISDHLDAATQRSNLTYDGAPICGVLRPAFVDGNTYRRASRAAGMVWSGVKTIQRLLMEDRSLRRSLFRMSAGLEKTVLAEQALGSPIPASRFDGVLTDHGEFKIIEISGMPGGLALSDMVAQTFRGSPSLAPLFRRSGLRHPHMRTQFFRALSDGHRRWGGRRKPRLAIIGSASCSLGSEMQATVNHLEKSGCHVIRGAVEDVRYSGGKLTVAGEPAEIVFLSDWQKALASDFCDPVHQAVRAGHAWSLNGCRARVIFMKNVFALLSDPHYHHLHDHEVVQAINRHVPWTRLLAEGHTTFRGQRIDLFETCLKRQKELVIKPVDGARGNGVVLGWTVDQETWRRALEHAKTAPFVVQERVRIPRRRYPVMRHGRLFFEQRYQTFDPFVWDEQRIGCFFVRLSVPPLIALDRVCSVPLFVLN